MDSVGRVHENDTSSMYTLTRTLADEKMGMHRDGARWNLPQEVVEERRKVFWECNAADVMQVSYLHDLMWRFS